MMFRQHFCTDGIVRGTAISGIDLALWDILGKLHGVPCHKALGRAGAGLRAPLLPSRWRKDGGVLRDHRRMRARFADLASQAVAEGFTAFKAMAVPETMPLEGLRPLRYAEACVGAMRAAVGDEVDIMVDCHARPSPQMGLRFAHALEPCGLYFLEEPCWPETLDDIALIQRSVTTPIATGERLVSSTRSKAAGKAGVPGASTGHHALRRPERGAADRGDGGSYKGGARAAQPAGARQHGGLAGVRFRDPFGHDLRVRPPRRAVARGGGEQGVVVEEEGRIVRPSCRPGLGIEINEAEVRPSVPAGRVAAEFPRGRERGGLVSVNERRVRRETA